MYIYVHVLRGFPTYILLFSCSLIYSVPLFLCLIVAPAVQCLCMPVRKTLAIEFSPNSCTCFHMQWLLRFAYMLFRYTSSLTESFRNASALLLAEACLVSALSLVCTPCGLCVVSLRSFGNRQMGLGCMGGACWPQCFASCWRVQLFQSSSKTLEHSWVAVKFPSMQLEQLSCN